MAVLCIILLIPTIIVRSVKCVDLLGLMGIFCLASETYLNFAVPSIRNTPGVFSRSLIIDWLPLIIIIAPVAIFMVLLLYVIVLTLNIQHPQPHPEAPPSADLNVVEHCYQARKAYVEIHRLICSTYLVLPFMFSLGSATSSRVANDVIRLPWPVLEVISYSEKPTAL